MNSRFIQICTTPSTKKYDFMLHALDNEGRIWLLTDGIWKRVPDERSEEIHGQKDI